MNFLIILVLCLLAATKVLTQSRFAKKNTKGIADSAMFNSTVFATMGLFALTMARFDDLNPSLIIGAACFGFFSISFQMMYQVALSCGPTSITALIASLASIIPLVISAVLYKEPLNAVNLVGVVLIVITLIMNADVKKDLGADKKKNVGKKWFLFIMLAFFSNSFGMISQQMYAKMSGEVSSFTFVSCASFVASILGFSVFGILRLKGHRLSYKLSAATVLPCIAVGVVLGTFQVLHTYALAVIPGTVLFPTYSAGATISIALGSTVVFREKLSHAQCVSLVIGIVAIVLINI